LISVFNIGDLMMKRIVWRAWSAMLFSIAVSACGGGGGGGATPPPANNQPQGIVYEGTVTASLTDGTMQIFLFGPEFSVLSSSSSGMLSDLTIDNQSGGITRYATNYELLAGTVGDIQGDTDYALGAWRGSGQVRYSNGAAVVEGALNSGDYFEYQYLVAKIPPAYPTSGNYICDQTIAFSRPALSSAGTGGTARSISGRMDLSFTATSADITSAQFTLTVDGVSTTKTLNLAQPYALVPPSRTLLVGALPFSSTTEGLFMAVRGEDSAKLKAVISYTIANSADQVMYRGHLVLGCHL
jgi:hypothetical protein